MLKNSFKQAFVLAMVVFAAACTVTDTQPPPLAGPSEMSLSLFMTANPDVLSLDGASQSQIVIEARDASGQPAANIPLRLEILADGVATDFGTLSARTLVIGSSGRATFTYTAPANVGGDIPDVDISVTPTGTDASAHVRRIISIRLVAPGVISPGGPTPSFTVTPAQPTAHLDVLFDASASRPAVGTAIVSYSWNFGDGTTVTETDPTTSHQFKQGTYTVTLTTKDSNGLTAATSKILQVGQGAVPTAIFVFSPTEPKAGQTIFFNAGQSTAGPNRTIVSYRWNFGDGDTGSGKTETHKYVEEGTYNIVLTVTDDVGQLSTAAASVTVCPVTGCEEEEP